MARPKRSDINDSNRRQALLLAASRLFNEKGFRGTTIRDIAAATQMHSGSPFYHFANKQELLFAVIMDGLQPLVDALTEIQAQPHPPLDRFKAMARTHVERMIAGDINTVATVATEWRFLDGEQIEIVMALRDRIDHIWQQALDDLSAAGLIRDSGAPVRLFFLGALTGIRLWYRDDGVLSPHEVADDLVGFLLHGANFAVPGDCLE